MKYVFQTRSMQRLYQAFLEDHDRCSVAGELALTRTMIQALILKYKGSPEQIPLAEAALLVEWAKDAVDAAKALTDIEMKLGMAVNVAQIGMITNELAKLVAKHVKDPIAVERICHALENLELPMPVPVDELLEFSDADEPNPELVAPAPGSAAEALLKDSSIEGGGA